MIQQDIIFTKKECEKILSLCGEFVRSGITNDGITVEITDDRTCYEHSFYSNKEVEELLLTKLSKYNIISLPDVVTVVRYKEGQYFDNHIDSGVGHEDRYKSVSIQLSDKAEYNGGDLIIWDFDENGDKTSYCSDRSCGNMVMFDSNLNHQVESVLSGTRYVLVFWLTKNQIND